MPGTGVRDSPSMRLPRSAVRSGAEHVLAHGPWHQASLRIARRRLVVLAYHQVPDRARFASHLDHLAANASPVDLDAVVAAARHGAELPSRPVLVTFDDGDVSVLEHALPELRARKIPAVVFVVADAVDSDLPHWWDEAAHLVEAGGSTRALPHSPTPTAAVRYLKRVPDSERRAALEELRATAPVQAPRVRHLCARDLRTLEEAGVTVGSHTMSHPCLHRCTLEVIRAEVEGSRRRLHELVGRSPTAFAYPNGDHDPRVRRAVEQAGYQVAFGFDHRLSPVPPPDPLRISRVRVDASATEERFASMVSGLHPIVHSLLRRP